MQTIPYRKFRIWEIKDEYTKNLAMNQVCTIFRLQDIRKTVSLKFLKLSVETPCWCPFEGPNMAARNQEKHLSLSFPTNAEFIP